MANRMANHLRRSGTARGSRIALSVPPESRLDCLAAMLGIMKGGYVVSLDGTGETLAGISALSEESLPCVAPEAELLPDEPVLEAGGRIFTARDLIDRSDRLRRRTGWHARDIPAVFASVNWHGILELTAALMYGNTVSLYPDAKPEEALSLLSAGTASLAGMSEETFCLAAESASYGQNGAQVSVPCRMVITDNCAEPPAADAASGHYRDAVRKWRTCFPHIPVNTPEAQFDHTGTEEDAVLFAAEENDEGTVSCQRIDADPQHA